MINIAKAKLYEDTIGIEKKSIAEQSKSDKVIYFCRRVKRENYDKRTTTTIIMPEIIKMYEVFVGAFCLFLALTFNVPLVFLSSSFISALKQRRRR